MRQTSHCHDVDESKSTKSRASSVVSVVEPEPTSEREAEELVRSSRVEPWKPWSRGAVETMETLL